MDTKSSMEISSKEDKLFLQRFQHIDSLHKSFQAYNKHDPFLATIKSAWKADLPSRCTIEIYCSYDTVLVKNDNMNKKK